MSEWMVNTGTVPKGVTKATDIEVEYRDGLVSTWKANDPVLANNSPRLWLLDGSTADVIKYRLL